MRCRLLALLLSIVAVAGLAGCGSSSGGSGSPLASELSYFPAGSPLVLTVQTDPNSPAIKQAHQLEAKFPLAALGQAAISSRLQSLGLNYDGDIRPLFGHPVAVGAPGPTFSTNGARSNFLIVWQTGNADKLNALLKKIGIGNPVGSRDGAKLYGSASTSLAVAGSTLVFGPSPSIVTAALDRHAHGGGITTAQYARETSGLSSASLVQVFGDLSGLLSQPSAARSRQIPWVAALRGYGVALAASGSGLSMQFHLDTTGRSLSAAQLPLASGSTAPALPNGGPIGAGVHDPAQIVAFAEAAAQQTGNAGFLKFLSRQSQLRARTGVDLTSFVRQFTGDLLVSSDTHATMVRATVGNPATFKADLEKLAKDPADAASQPGTTVRRLPGGFFALVEPKQTITVGLVGNQLVGGKAPLSALRAFATAPATPAGGAQGAAAFRIALPQLLHLAVHGTVPQVARQILAQLGDLTGWASASPSGVTASASLAVR